MSDGCFLKDINYWSLNKIINKIKIKNNQKHPFVQITSQLNKLKHKNVLKNNFVNLLKTDINSPIYYGENDNYQIIDKLAREYIAVDVFIK